MIVDDSGARASPFDHQLSRAITDYLTISPSFLRADSQRGAAELTIARRKRGRVVLLF